MENERKERVKHAITRYGISFAIGMAIAVLVAKGRGWNAGNAAYLNARYASDGLFVACIVFLGIGSLVWVSSTGFFDIFRYGFRSLLVLFTPLRKPEENGSYYEYKAEREAKRAKPSWFMLIVGAVFLLLSFLCLYLYYHLPQ